MTILQTIAVLAAMFTPQPKPYNLPVFNIAIVQAGMGSELSWYTPTVTTMAIPGAPAGWRAAASCQPIVGGAVVLNPLYSGDPGVAADVMHELIHLHRGCSGSETDTELAAMEVMAYLGRDADIAYWLINKAETVNSPRLPGAVMRDYYLAPLARIQADDLAEYPHLRRALVELGILEQDWGGRR